MLNQNHTLLHQVYTVVQTSAQNAFVNSNNSHVLSQGAATIVTHNARATRLADCSSNPILHRSRGECYTISFPRWLTRRCFEIAWLREMSSLQFNLTSYNIVERKAPGYKAARRGDLNKLKRLLQSGQASPFDQTDNGETLFQAAIRKGKLDIAQFLMGQWPGLGCRVDIVFMQKLLSDWTRLYFVTDLAQLLNSLSRKWDFLTKCIDIDEDLLHEVELYLQAHGTPGLWTEWLPLISRAAYQGIEILPKDARISLAVSTSVFNVFEQMIGANISTQDVLQVISHRESNHADMLCSLLSHAFHQDSDEMAKWSGIVRDIFEFDKRRGPAFCWSKSTMRWFLHYARSGSRWSNKHWRPSAYPELWNDILRQWIQYLENIGVDLVHYGQRETDATDVMGIEQFGCWICLGFDCGPKAIDWKFHFLEIYVEYEDWARQFRDRIEDPELYFVPGTFPVDEADDFWNYELRCLR